MQLFLTCLFAGYDAELQEDLEGRVTPGSGEFVIACSFEILF